MAMMTSTFHLKLKQMPLVMGSAFKSHFGPTLLDLVIIKEEVEDPRLKEIIAKIEAQKQEVPNFSLQQGVLKYKGRLVLSKTSSLLSTILHTYHDSIFNIRRHSGYLRTYKRLTGEVYWEGMKKDVKKYCEECSICQRNKTLALSLVGLLMPLEIPDAFWNDISMDFIEGLPKVAGWKVIMVVVDRMSSIL
ncbi:transposon Tf2-1 polyprotein isoform X1 [Cucumis melo var. makuwa]|uniref:Transposon Tf2-1 polyprotein isoform X1 n=1 Tax=Cucumis melo var. makuwa TaxID=1194695 RepID=A0A5D3BRS1_CUCMM|nr:transposon Tf2-1 polyprotein isoform X1 [Cucumis melo var. makuwa]